jgi:nitrite reductase/ring-hydroxylating ferredoxin subunit
MFEPTIKYRRVNDPPKEITKSQKELNISNTNSDKQNQLEATNTNKSVQTSKPIDSPKISSDIKEDSPKPTEDPYAFTFEEESEGESTIEVDPNDKERIIITLSTGKQFSADRYCPHAGADLSYHGKVSEHDYPPEIGPVLMCPIHYWEFALEKGGRGGSGRTTINACSVEVADKCANSAERKTLEW